MLYGPLVLIIVSAIIFGLKVTLTEARHAEIVKQLEAKFGMQPDDAKSEA
jgi:lactose/raffinose/galactose permease